MGFLDDLMNQGGGSRDLAALAAQNPQLLAAAASLLSDKPDSVGGSGGLGGLIGSFQKAGLGDVMASWISTGQNQNLSPDRLGGVLGQDTLRQFAAKAGIDPAKAAPLLAMALPLIIDKLTPDGNAPAPQRLDGLLGSLLGGR